MKSTAPILPGALTLLFATLALTAPGSSNAMPVFARQYDISCNVCHAAYPRLNAFGEQFAANNFRLPNWREQHTAPIPDDMLVLPSTVPLALRAQAYVQGRQGEEIDPDTGPTGNDAGIDIQAPYLIKLLSSAPLSEHITYYFYGIFAEKGGNGETVIEDAWFRHDDIFATGIGMMLGQFQISDLMFPRETRLTFQDFMVYRMAGVTYDRGLLFDRDVGPVELGLGATNGNGIEDNFDVNSPGYRRPDNMFDTDTRKTAFGRIGTSLGPISIGVFGLTGEQRSVTTASLGQESGDRDDTNKRIAGVDLSGQFGARSYWFAQALWNEWEGFLEEFPDDEKYRWFGAFAGVDYVRSERWAYSLLFNYADADDFEDSGTIFEGIDIKTITLGASYYFMRNVKGTLELNIDLLEEDDDFDFLGHETKEGYILLGFDAAF